MKALGELQPGTVFARDFRIVRKLASGGMGALYVAEQLTTGRQRALKLMHPTFVDSPELREKFALEARVGARIESEHVIEVVAAGVDDDVPWLAMELLVGSDLAAELKKRGHFSREEVARILGQVGHALGAAHRAGIVHRDLKPENVLLAETRRMSESYTVKLLDFGIAKVVEAARSANTGAVGTPLWMAPEQSERDAQITPSTDVWAFGLVAFKLLTGRSFWLSGGGEGVAAVLRELIIDPIPSASARARELGVAELVPAGFDAWFAQCVCRDPAGRFVDATAAANALSEALGLPARVHTGPVRISLALVGAERDSSDSATELGVARTVGTPAPAMADARTAPEENEEPATLPLDGSGPRWLLPTFGAAVLVVGGAALFFAQRGSRVVVSVPDAAVETPGLPFCPREMGRVKGDTFTMGSAEEGPPHAVKVAPFCVDLTEVSVSEYAACVHRKGCAAPSTEASVPGGKKEHEQAWSPFCNFGRAGKTEHPMNCVTFDEAAAYCRQAGKRLPSEEEWEYAARGSDGRSYPWGSAPPASTRMNGCDQGCASLARATTAEILGQRLQGDDGAEATAPIGSYLQGVSPFGAFDLAGNVAEWVDATFCPYGQTSCGASTKVVRGGSWADDRPTALTATARGKASPATRMPDIGFRCVK